MSPAEKMAALARDERRRKHDLAEASLVMLAAWAKVGARPEPGLITEDEIDEATRLVREQFR